MAHEYIRNYRQRLDASGSVVAATTASALALIPDKLKETVYITRIVVSVTTAGAGILTFRDRGLPVPIFVVPSSASVGQYSVEFGDDGYPLTEGKGMDLVGSTNGVVAVWKVEAIRRGTSPKSIAEAQASA
jgi:hypothetical protein